MANLTLGADAAVIEVQIRDKIYPLKTKPGMISIPGTPTIPKSLQFYYDDPGNPIDAGTLKQLLDDLESGFATTPLPANEKLTAKWNGIKSTLSKAPFFGSAIDTVENTNVQIVEIELALERKDNDSFTGKFRLGLVFTPETRPQLFNISVVRLGTTLVLGFEGNVSQLGGWPA